MRTSFIVALAFLTSAASPAPAADTENGNVALEGEAPNQTDKDQAGTLAKHVQGVRQVANNLAIQP